MMQEELSLRGADRKPEPVPLKLTYCAAHHLKVLGKILILPYWLRLTKLKLNRNLEKF